MYLLGYDIGSSSVKASLVKVADGYTIGMYGFTASSALIGCIIGSALSGLCASRLGRKRSLFLAGILFFLSALGSYYPEFLFFEYGQPSWSLLVTFNLYRILGGICVVAVLFVWMLVPETKGKTLEEMTRLWKKE